MLGNHDRELYYPECQKVLTAAVTAAAKPGVEGPAPASIRFEPWFFLVPGEIFAEHGQQYDDYATFRYLLWPVVPWRGEQVLALPMGNLSNRYLMSRMGYFNPHASDFILNLFSYFFHWLRFYAFTRRSLVWPWFWGSVQVIARMLQVKRLLRTPPSQHEERMEQIGRDNHLDAEDVRALAGLQHKPITSRMFRLLRELWADRVAIAVLMTGGTIALALVPIPLWIKLMVPLSTFPLIYFIYEKVAEGETIFTIEKEIPKRARLVARLVPVRIVTFGHTHKPRLIPLSTGVSFVDTGTWAPVMDPNDRGRLVPGLRNYLEAVFQGGEVRATLGSWMPDPLGPGKVGPGATRPAG